MNGAVNGLVEEKGVPEQLLLNTSLTIAFGTPEIIINYRKTLLKPNTRLQKNIRGEGLFSCNATAHCNCWDPRFRTSNGFEI